jgi:CBS-domain-containing membrane protein
MSEGNKVKLAFHAVVANCCGNLAVSIIILDVAICFAIGLMFTYNYLEPPSLIVVGLQNLYEYHEKTQVM